MPVEKSGVHLTGADSGWPVGAASEPPYRKAGNGTDVAGHDALSAAGHAIHDAAGVAEQQTITQSGTGVGGTFQLGVTIDGEKQDTAAIAAGAALTAATVQSAIEKLTAIHGGDVTVTGATGGPFTITFHGQFSEQDVPQVTVDNKALTGTTPNVVAATATPGAA